MSTKPQRLQVFSTEEHSAQITWGWLHEGPAEFEVAGRRYPVDKPDAPGAVMIDGLESGTHYRVQLHRDQAPSNKSVLSFTTLAPAPGEELFRFATLNDVHLGQSHFGYFHTMRERPQPLDPHPVRCAQAALDEAVAWGAKEIVVKGDMTEKGTEAQWRLAGEVFREVPVPVQIIAGNHDVYRRRTIDPFEGAVTNGLSFTDTWATLDRPGVRLILLNTAIPGRGKGRIPVDLGEISAAAGEAPGGVVVAMHHNLQTQALPHFWPPGIPGPEAEAFLDALLLANPSTLVTSGHTHRNRRRTHGRVTVTEVGSTKDYPGVWAGYVVYEGGIRQIVRRVQRPDCIAWTDYTRKAVNGVWGLWSPGRLDDRCFTAPWVPAVSPAMASV